MIDSSQIAATFRQTGGSCVLASYAVAHNYFTSKPVAACFEAYCRHFKLTFAGAKEAEAKYDQHFHEELQQRCCTGYQLILHLHHCSMEPGFVTGREHFDCQLYENSAKHIDWFDEFLQAEEAILNITVNGDAACHSVSVFADSTGLLKKDTNDTNISPVRTISDLGSVRDAVLYQKKPATRPATSES